MNNINKEKSTKRTKPIIRLNKWAKIASVNHKNQYKKLKKKKVHLKNKKTIDLLKKTK